MKVYMFLKIFPDLRQCTDQVNDIVIAVDANPYLDGVASTKIARVVASFMNYLNISENGTRVSIVNFRGDGWYMKTGLDTYFDVTILAHVVRHASANESDYVQYRRGNRLSVFDEKYGGRVSVNDVVVVFTSAQTAADGSLVLPYHPLVRANILKYIIGVDVTGHVVSEARLAELREQNTLVVGESELPVLEEAAMALRKQTCDNVKQGTVACLQK